MEQFGCVMLLVLLLPLTFQSVPVLSRMRRFLWLLHVPVVKLTQFALCIIPPVRQIDAIPCALMCICREALTVAHLRWTLAHIHLTELKILVRIHSTVAVSKEIV